MFISELCVNLALWVADTRQGGRGNVLYIFPSRDQLGDFVRARIDPVVEESPYLQTRVKPVRGVAVAYVPTVVDKPSTPGSTRRPRSSVVPSKSTDSVGLKRVGDGFIYFRGSNAEAGLLTVDADLVIYDEVDRLRPNALALGQKRLGSSLLGWQRFASTPVYPDVGIDALWQASDMREWHVKCTACNEWQPLCFPENLSEAGVVICRKCHQSAGLNRLGPGEWVAARSDVGNARHGYHVTKLLSPFADLPILARIGYAVLRKELTDIGAIQEFYNQDLGLAHTAEGGQLGRADIAGCLAEYSLGNWVPAATASGVVMGVDVGVRLHVVVLAPGPNQKPRAAWIGTVGDFAELDALMTRFDVSVAVVDAQPERHEAHKFAQRFDGRVWLAFYPDTERWAYEEPAIWKDDEHVVSAHRTFTLDAAMALIRERRVELPSEVLDLPDFKEHLMALVRIVQPGRDGNLVARYTEGGQPDHYGMAFNYACVAGLRYGAPAVERVVERQYGTPGTWHQRSRVRLWR